MLRRSGKCLLWLAVLGTLGLAACERGGAAAQEPPEGKLVLRVYDVPATHGPEVVGILNGVLWRSKDVLLGRAQASPSGQVLVAAPEEFQEGVKQLLAGMQKEPPPAPPSIRVDYWIVVGRPGDGPPEDSTGLAGEAIAALQKVQPSMQLKALEQLRLTSTSGEEASTVGAFVSVQQTATAYQGRILARIKMAAIAGPNSFETQVELPVDKTLVIGQSGLVGASQRNPFTGETPNDTNSLDTAVFYVIRAHVSDQ